jgi:hypothetical protein
LICSRSHDDEAAVARESEHAERRELVGQQQYESRGAVGSPVTPTARLWATPRLDAQALRGRLGERGLLDLARDPEVSAVEQGLLTLLAVVADGPRVTEAAEVLAARRREQPELEHRYQITAGG